MKTATWLPGASSLGQGGIRVSGDSLLIHPPGGYHPYLLYGYVISGVSMSCDSISSYRYGEGWEQYVHTSYTFSFEVKSVGHVSSSPTEQELQKFRTVEELSIDELARILHQRIARRDLEEGTRSKPLFHGMEDDGPQCNSL